MQRLQAYRFELKPNGEQQRLMRRFAGSCRFVYNKALAMQQERHKAGEKKLGYASLCKSLTEWKAQAETLWLSETPSQPLQQSLKNLERAYKNFFEKRANLPVFKKKGQSDRFRYRRASKSTKATAAYTYPSSAGFATATAGTCWVKSRTLPSANPAASGWSPSRRSAR